MVDITSRLRLVVDSTGVDRGGRSLRDLRREAQRADEQAARLRSTFASLAGVLGAAFSLREITRTVDAYRGIENQLRLVTASATELRSAQEGVLQVANETGAALNSTVGLYANLERFAGEFLNSQAETLELTRAINQAALISGAGVQETSNAIRQLSQGIAGGILRAEEFNSIIENMPRLGQALADGLGVGIGELRAQVNDGLITSERLITGLQSQFGALDEEFQASSKTIGQALQGIGNSITVELGQKLAGVQDVAVDALTLIGANLETIIPLVEGFAASLALLGAGFALPALAAGFAALVSPIGAVAVAFGALVAFRDDVANALFGVSDAGAVIQATFEVLSPLIMDAGSAIASFVSEAIDSFAAFGVATAEVLGGASAAISNIIPDGAIETVAGFTQGFVSLFVDGLGVINELIFDAILAPLRLAAGALEGLGQINLLPDGQQAKLQGAADALRDIADSSDRITGRETIESFGNLAELIVGGVRTVADGSVEIFEDIRERAQEIGAENASTTEALADQQDEYVKLTKSVDTVATLERERAATGDRIVKTLEAEQQAIRDKEFLLKAANESEREYEIAQELLRLRRAGLDITEEEIQGLAEQNVQLDEQLEKVRGINDEAMSVFDSLGDTVQDIWADFSREGFGAIDDIARSIGDLFSDGFEDGFSGVFAGLEDAFGSIKDFLDKEISGSFEGGLGSLFGQNGGGSGGFSNLASSASGNITGGFGGASMGIGFGSQIRGPNEANSANQQIGAGIGAGIGAALGGPIGASIGGALGGITGSFFGNRSDYTGQTVFDPTTGQNLGTDRRDNSQEARENQRTAQQVEQAITDVTTEFAAISGGEFSRLLNVAVGSRDGLAVGFQGSDGRLENTVRAADPEQLAEEGIRLALTTLEGGTAAITDTITTLAAAGAPLDEVLSVAETITVLTEGMAESLSPFAQALQDLNTTYDDALQSVEGITSAEKALNDARNEQTKALQEDFLTQVETAELERQGGAFVGFRALAESNATLLEDEQALFGTSNQTSLLRAGNFEDFFAAAFAAGESVDDVEDDFRIFRDIVRDVGGDVDALTRGFDDAAQAARALTAEQEALAEEQRVLAEVEARRSVDDQVQADIDSFLNGPTDQLNRLLEDIDTRRQEVEDVGGDLEEFERLASLQLNDFFSSLTDDAITEVESYLGLFEEATESVARNLDLSREDLRSQADFFGSQAQTFANLGNDFNNQFIAQTPRESIDSLQAEASDLLAQTRLGNEDAAAELPQVLQDLVDNARTTFGNTSEFADVLEFAQGITQDAELASLDIQSEAEKQIAALDENNDILADIRDILESSEATNAVLSSAASGGVSSSDALLALIQEGAGLTPANDNATLSVSSVFGQSLAPAIDPLTNGINSLNQTVSELPSLQQFTIEAIQRGAEQVVEAVDRVEERLDRIEVLERAQLAELERLQVVAA